jgi:hypothetical protein
VQSGLRVDGEVPLESIERRFTFGLDDLLVNNQLGAGHGTFIAIREGEQQIN